MDEVLVKAGPSGAILPGVVTSSSDPASATLTQVLNSNSFVTDSDISNMSCADTAYQFDSVCFLIHLTLSVPHFF